MHPVLKWSVRIASSLAVLVLLLVAGVVVLLNTSSGTRWAIDRIVESVPGELLVGNVDGTLWKGLNIQRLTYRDDAQEIEVDDLALDIDWPRVSIGQVALQSLNAHSVRRRSLLEPDPAPSPLELSMQPLPVDIVLGRAEIRELQLGEKDDVIAAHDILVVDARVDGNTFRAEKLAVSSADISFTATAVATTLAGDVPTSTDIRWQLVDTDLQGDGTLRGTLADLNVSQTISGEYAGDVSANVRILHRVLPDFDADFDIDLRLQEAQTRIRGTASGDTTQLTALDAHVEHPIAAADVSGVLTWAPVRSADVVVHASGIDVAELVAELSGTLEADARIRIDEPGTVTATGLAASGIVNNAPMKASGDVTWAQAQLRCANCSLAVGTNLLQLDGDVSRETVNASLTLNAPVLHELWPPVSGAAQGKGTISGDVDEPAFSGEIHARNIAFGEWFVRQVDVVSRELALDAMDATATLAGVKRQDDDLGTVSVTVSGEPENLDFTTAWDYRELRIMSAGDLQRDGDNMDGVVRTASVTEPNTGVWRLVSPFAFSVAPQMTSIAEHTWSGVNGELHIATFSAADDELVLVADLKGLPLQLANEFLPENFALSGVANAEVDVMMSAGEWSGTIDWQQLNTLLRAEAINDQSADVSIPLAQLHAVLRDGGVAAEASMAIEPAVSGELTFELSDFTGNADLAAQLQFRGDEWSWVSAVFPELDGLEGKVVASVSAVGQRSTPEFSGNVEWKNGRLLVPALNVPLENIELNVTGASHGSATMKGSAKAGDGNLLLEGRFNELMQTTRSMTLNVTGENAELMNWPEYKLWATPEITITGDKTGWQINGEIAVPRADITLREMPVGAVRVSPDVVILGEETPVAEPTRISGEARLVLGEKVHISALGLNTDLEGNVLMTYSPDRPPRANGNVTLVDGVFEAYGQKLTISQGELTFTGPLDNPIVNVNAVRRIDTLDGEVTAGIQLRGRAQDLTSTVFAEPAMADADALSYLVTGRPLNQATEAEGGDLTGAAVALGLKQASRLTDQIGQSVGLDQLSLTGDGGETTALVAGKQVNSRLHARYVYGVFSRLGTLLMRYKMTRNLSIEAGAGEVQSIDIVYSIETD